MCPFFRKYAQGTQFDKDDIRIDDKVIVVTGCNTGIGKETVLELAKRGAKVYMACRNSQKCEVARLEIIQKSGNKNVLNRELDVSSLESVRKFVDKFLKEESRLDILINNAGVMAMPRTVSVDGFEMQFATNHLGHFLLTNLLLDTLVASAPSKIINVSSRGHAWGKINRDDVQGLHGYSSWGAYTQSKLANVLFTRELAKRLDGTEVTANAVHPGTVSTELSRHMTCLALVATMPLRLFFKTAKAGAQTTLAIALDPDYNSVTGKYFSDCKIRKESQAAQDDETADWLWRTSEKLVGLTE